MAYLAKIQYKYNDLLEDARERKSPVLSTFKKTIRSAIKALPVDAQREITHNSIPMQRHLEGIIDGFKKNNSKIIADYLTYYYVFNEVGKAVQIQARNIKSTIEEMPRLVRHSKTPDAVPYNRFQDTETTDTFLLNREASPEADIQNLYEDFVGQINADLASVEDIRTYPEMLAELYRIIRTQIPKSERLTVLKKVNEMIAQFYDLETKKKMHPNKRYTISPIDIRETTKGLYPEEYSSGTKMMDKKQPKYHRKRIEEDEPINTMDVVDFFEHIPSDYVSGKQTIVQQKPQGLKRRNTQEDPQPIEKTDNISILKKVLKDMGTDYTSNQFIAEIPAMRKKVSRQDQFPVEATLRPERKERKPRAKKAQDPADISKWPLPELKDFMREHGLKGITKKKAEIINIIQQYIA